MRVLVAGATGVLGKQIVPLLVSAGHDVIGLARSRPAYETTGPVRTVAVDALDRPAVAVAVAAVVREAAPDAVVNVLTAIPAELNPKRMARQFQLTIGCAPRAPATCWRRPRRSVSAPKGKS